MRINKTTNLSAHYLDSVSDTDFIYMLAQKISKNRVDIQLFFFDPETFKITNSFWLNEQLYIRKIFPYNEYIYFITGNGLTGYDSFSGEPVSIIDVGQVVPMEVLFKDNYIFSVCGIPLVNITKIDTDKICICVNDEETGKKLFQSQNMSSGFLPPILDDFLWISDNKILYKYSLECRLEKQVRLHIVPDYSPIVSQNHVITASKTGTLEIFDRNLIPVVKMIVSKNNSPPLMINDELIWFTQSKIQTVNLTNFKVATVGMTRNDITSSVLSQNNCLYATDDKGYIIQFNVKDKSLQYLRLCNEPLNKLIHAGNNYIFTSSANMLYHIGV